MIVAFIFPDPLEVGDLVWVIDHAGEEPPVAVEVVALREREAEVVVCGLDADRRALNAHWVRRDNLARKRVSP